MHRAQATLEYIFVLGIFVAALIATGIYMNRGFQGRYRDLGEQIGPQYSPASTLSTSVSDSTSIMTVNSTSTVKKSYIEGGVSTTLTQEEKDKTEGYNGMHLNTDDETAALESRD